MKSNSKHKAFALTKTRAAPLIAAALMTLIALFGITACPNNVEGAVTGTANGGNTGGLKWHEAPFIEGGASLILSPDKLTIRVTVTTSDNSPITVEGCDKTELTSGTRTELKAKNTGVVFKGKITKLQVGDRNASISNKLTALNVQGLNALEYLSCFNNQLAELNVQSLNALKYLDCGGNQLTALNVQGLSALQGLNCGGNQLTELNVQGLNALKYLECGNIKLTALNVQGSNVLRFLNCPFNKLTADAFIKLFNDLPQRTANEGAECYLYSELVSEDNHKDFTSPGKLKTAFDNAKTVKNWKMYKFYTNGSSVEI